MRAVALVLQILAAACHGDSPTSPWGSPASTAGGEPFEGEPVEVSGVVTDERGTPMPGAMVTMGLFSIGALHWPSTLTDASGSYRISFTAMRHANGFVARAQVVADGYEEYWRSIMRSTDGTAFIENFRLDRIVRVTAGDSIVLTVPPDVGDCRGWVAEVCPIVRVTAPSQGRLTIEVEPVDQRAELPPVEVCCVDGDERYGNPITVAASSGRELEVKVGLRRGFVTIPRFLVRTSFDP